MSTPDHTTTTTSADAERRAADRAAVARVENATRTDRAVSAVGWWTPEIGATTTVAAAGGLTVHPTIAAAAYAVLGVRIAWAHLAARRTRTRPTTGTDGDRGDEDRHDERERAEEGAGDERIA